MGTKHNHYSLNFEKRALDPGPGSYGSKTTESFNKGARSWKPVRYTHEANRGSESARRQNINMMASSL